MSISSSRTILWAIAISLWLGALVATILASDGHQLTGVVFVLTRPIVTALAATLSIALIGQRITRHNAEGAVIWNIAYKHGFKDGGSRS